jgi:chlorobactene glucosyltransferase
MEIVVQPVPLLSLAKPLPLISLIVPARNEERNIRRSVEALLAQTYPNDELIVVDDRSTDRTPAILAGLQRTHEKLKVIEGGELPEGWAGKPHALFQGVQAAQGSWLCFIDADTFAQPELLASTLECARSLQADMFTILTEQELGGFWEKAILPLVFTALSFGFPASKVNDPTQPDAIANGQFILIRRQVYEAVGGHAAVHDRIDEDKALAQVVKRAGYRLVVADGRQVAVTRMYTSLADMWEGWTKNIYLGMQDRQGLLLFGALVGLIAALALPFWLIGGIIWALAGGGWIAWLVALEAAALWAFLLRYRVQASRAFHISPWYALSLPLGALVFTGMMAASAYKILSGQGVTWRGRRYVR